MYKDGELGDDDVHANLVDLVTGKKPGRESDDERTYFNAVGLAYTDIGIAYSMFRRASEAGEGTRLALQETMIFKHPDLAKHIRIGTGKSEPASA
jgi:ornithine cyclodeaminase/alanine dehydrogenase-like protein (mu-crystallin family)